MNRRRWLDLGGAALIVAAASGLRALLFADLGRAIPYATFYPAIMAAAVLGGLPAGLLATALSAVVCYVWVDQGHLSSAEWLAMAVFVLSGAFIAGAMESTRRANARAEQARLQAERANRSKDVFLANMSHELRTPLNAVLGFSRQLRDAPDVTARQVPILEIITRSGEHLLEVINNVLDVAKVASGRIELEERHADLREIVGDVDALMGSRASSKGLKLSLHFAPDVPGSVVVDTNKLRQVLINLVGNAIKFTGAGSVTMRVLCAAQGPRGETRAGAATRQRLRFEVEDTGPGIDVADRERVFEAFVQLSGRGSSERGTGLGLTISRQFAGLMGGQIAVTPGASGGSLFTLDLPVGIPSTEEAANARRRRRVVGLEAGQPAYRILIAEDMEENRLLLRTMVEPLGFVVREANDGAEAVSAFEQWAPHLVLMDIRMPVMDGLEATKRIRAMEAGRSAKIVAVTAHALSAERSAILAAGCDAVIRKPVEEEEIIAALESLLGARFTHTKSDEPPDAPELEAAHLEALPLELVAELRRAVELLDARACLRVVRRIEAVDAPLASRLRCAIENLKFRGLLELLDQIEMNGGAS